MFARLPRLWILALNYPTDKADSFQCEWSENWSQPFKKSILYYNIYEYKVKYVSLYAWGFQNGAWWDFLMQSDQHCLAYECVEQVLLLTCIGWTWPKPGFSLLNTKPINPWILLAWFTQILYSITIHTWSYFLVSSFIYDNHN